MTPTIALVVTTVNIPTALALQSYAANHAGYLRDVDFATFVVGDQKSPDEEIVACLKDLKGRYYSVERQKSLSYACSELIGWSCPERRNIGFLEALKWGAEVIITTDDDNLCLDLDYINDIVRAFELRPRLLADSDTGWFDVGQLLVPKAPHRGFPHYRLPPTTQSFSSVVDAKVGIAASICLGDPDVSAMTRIVNAPSVHQVSELLRSGIVVDPNSTWTVFNSQNTAFIREIAPAMFQFPGLGRDTDIFASLITQRVMRDLGYVTHFGKPFVYQQRNQHDLIDDLHKELLDYDHLYEFTQWLDGGWFPSDPKPIGSMRAICRRAKEDLDWWPSQATEAGLAWCEDISKVM